MPIAISCPCGAPLEAPDDLAGQRVMCPTCRRALNVPKGQIAASPAAAGSTGRPTRSKPSKSVHFHCACGKGMRAQKAYAGRLARCPACGDNVIIPNPAEDAAGRFRVDTRTPIPRETSRSANDVPRAMSVNDDEEEEEDRPRRRRPRRKSGQDGSKALIWCGLALLLLTSLGALGAATWWLVVTPDTVAQKETPPPKPGALYAAYPPPAVNAAPVTLYIPQPQVSFPDAPRQPVKRR